MMSIDLLCFFLSPFFRMSRLLCCYLVSCFIFSSFLFDGTDACWGKTAPNYGDMTRDYDLLVGSDLVLNCTLRKKSFPDFSRTINSSDLVIERGNEEFSKFTRVIDDYTIQLKIPEATMNLTGVYICKIFFSKEYKPVVCGSKVSVGYPPHHVTNITCLSRNLDNLYCSWHIEESSIVTKYSIVKYLYNLRDYQQKCPIENEKLNSCEWTNQTVPSYEPFFRYIAITVIGNNSLGKSVDNFMCDTYSFVIPNPPENLEVLHVDNQFATIGWGFPSQKKLPSLKCQIWVTEAYNSSDVLIYDTRNSELNFTIRNLAPHITYNVSIRCISSYIESNDNSFSRCQSSYANSDMWSAFASLEFKTLADVPYKIPEVIPEAYELHIYKDSRSADLYWKTVSKLDHNGEKFHYHIKYFKAADSNASKIHTVNSSIPFINIKNLSKDSSYFFHIYSANENGISKDYGSIFIASEEKMPPAPKDVRVISQDIGHYNLSWNPPNDEDLFNYRIFWCSSLKPWLSRCDSSIQWINDSFSDTNIVLKLSDIKKNFQFAVVSKSESGSSGMQWADCIVPPKGGLNKIKYMVVEQKSSTSLKVIWNLDCPAEKSVVKKYEITFCNVEKHRKCNVVEVEPNADNFLLENLHPFTNYSIKIRAINNHNKSSEDSDAVFQSTLPGAPSGPPQNVHISSNSMDSFFVNWTAPLEPNGNITMYIVSYNGSKEHIDGLSAQNEYSMEINGLKPYSTYAVQIQACVNIYCSVKSDPVMIQTEVDEPGHMEPPRIEEVNSTHFKVSWTAPMSPNGPVDFYVIKWHQEKQNASSDSDNILEVAGTDSVILDVKCPAVGEEAIKYLFYIRAVNKKNGTNLFGPFSKPLQAKACLRPEGLGMFIGTIVGATFGAIFFLIIIYRFTIWMRFKIHQVKSIAIRLPEGLEGPETNPLNNYECFKDGLNGNIQSNNSERLSYIIDENKNRHGSGSSQFSNSSAEELIFKNGKCSKFGRKPSGDSSGCSSMSSSATPRIHLSSDSGTESDFVIPPSPDSAITDSNLHNSYKAPLPILMEVYDQPSLEQSLQQTMSPDKQYYNFKMTADDTILKVDPPYSKFGYAGNATSSVPWRINPLVFYSCNLANSEPSVFDMQKPEKNETVMAPYSKVGLAKSSGDIGMTNVKQIGYSKFGYPTYQKRFSIPPDNLNPVTMVMLENPEKKEWPHIKKILVENYKHSKINENANVTIPSNNLVEDTGYIKVGVGGMCPKGSNHGYVPFNDLRNQMDQNNSPIYNLTDQMRNMHSTSINDKDQLEFPDDTDWSTFDHCEEENRAEDSPEILLSVPFTSSSAPVESGAFVSNSFGFKPPGSENSSDSLLKIPSESDAKYSSESPVITLHEVSFESNPILQNHTAKALPYSNILQPVENVTPEESHQNSISYNRTNAYDISSEVIVTPMTLKNNYVPFNSLSNSVCDRTLTSLPNVSELNIPHTNLPNGVCTETDSYAIQSQKKDFRLLRENSFPKTVSENIIQNGNGYANLSLKYILKPLPKMESEICEV